MFCCDFQSTRLVLDWSFWVLAVDISEAGRSQEHE
jgi:hypothetical protein